MLNWQTLVTFPVSNGWVIFHLREFPSWTFTSPMEILMTLSLSANRIQFHLRLILQSKFNYNNWVQFDSKNFTHNTAMKKAKFLKLHCLVGGWWCKVTQKTITLSIKVLSLILCEPTLRIYEFSPCNLNFSSVQTNPNRKNLFFNSNVNILLHERLNTLQASLIWNLKSCFLSICSARWKSARSWRLHLRRIFQSRIWRLRYNHWRMCSFTVFRGNN